MMNLHRTIENIYIKVIKPLIGIEVQTENGWAKIESVNVTEKTKFFEIRTEKRCLLCTKNHILIDRHDQEILAVDSKDKEVKTVDGIERVIDVKELDIVDNAYDLSLADDSNHLYFANGLLSHNCVVMDEAAFVPNNIASRVFESIFPVISSSKNSQFIMVSTPNGADTKNLYYELYQKAVSKNVNSNLEGWKAFRFEWFDVPGRDQKWKEETIAAIGEQRFAQEFGNEFLASSTVKKLIPDDIIEKHRVMLSEIKALDKEFAMGKTQRVLNDAQDKVYEFKMWHEFDPKHTYLASGDCAEGVGSDASVLYIWDVTDLSNIRQCAKFASNQVSTVEFAFITSKILKLYNNPFYICERNGVGSGYLDSLKITYQYANIVKEGKGGEAGVFSHVITKEKACLWAREMMTTLGFGWTIYDKELIEEFSVFVKKENKGVHQIYQAAPPAHDDCVMAWVWACWILQPDLVERYFVCCETFTSQVEKIYPKLLQPLRDYTREEIKAVSKDPLHQRFLDFKDEIQNKLGKAIYDEQIETKNDPYLKAGRPKVDAYFGDLDDGNSWNSVQNSQMTRLHQPIPDYYIL